MAIRGGAIWQADFRAVSLAFGEPWPSVMLKLFIPMNKRKVDLALSSTGARNLARLLSVYADKADEWQRQQAEEKAKEKGCCG